MKTAFLLGTSISTTMAATGLPLKNFPGVGRGLAAYDQSKVLTNECQFATLGELLPPDTVEVYEAEKDLDLNYIGGIATRVQLSDKTGYNYFMRSNLNVGDLTNTWIEYDQNAAGVWCEEIEENQLTSGERGLRYCGRHGAGIHSSGGKFYSGDDINGVAMDLSGVALASGIDNSDDICNPATLFVGTDQAASIFTASTCNSITDYSLEEVSPHNGISSVTRTCTTGQSTTSCTTTIGGRTIDLAIASTCGVARTPGAVRIGHVDQAFVWYRYVRPPHTIVTTTTPNGDVSVELGGGTNAANEWIGDILYTQPQMAVIDQHLGAAFDVTALYVSSATASVTFSDAQDSTFSYRCSVSQADGSSFGSLDDATSAAQDPTVAEPLYDCTAQLVASAELSASAMTGCNPGAYFKSSLVQFAKLHTNHVEEGVNHTATGFATATGVAYNNGIVAGYKTVMGGAAAKYAVAAGLTQTPASASGDAKNKKDVWQCVVDCVTGNPFVVLSYNEDADIYDPESASPGTNGDSTRLTIGTDSTAVELVDPKTLNSGNDAAVAYTYVIGYVDLGYGCFHEDAAASDMPTRRLGHAKPQTWELASQMIFAGGHHVNV